MRRGVRVVRSGGGEDDGVPVAGSCSFWVVGGCHVCFVFCRCPAGNTMTHLEGSQLKTLVYRSNGGTLITGMAFFQAGYEQRHPMAGRLGVHRQFFFFCLISRPSGQKSMSSCSA